MILQHSILKIYLYSLSKYNKNTIPIHYYSTDTHCDARIKLSLEKNNENKNINNIITKNF